MNGIIESHGKGQLLKADKNRRVSVLEGLYWLSTGKGKDVILRAGDSIVLRDRKNLLEGLSEVNQLSIMKLDKSGIPG